MHHHPSKHQTKRTQRKTPLCPCLLRAGFFLSNRILIAIFAEQLSFILVDNSIIAPAPGKAIPCGEAARGPGPAAREPGPSPAGPGAEAPALGGRGGGVPEGRDNERDGADDGHGRREGEDRVADPGGVVVDREAAAGTRPLLAEADGAELAAPVAVDVRADGGCDGDGDGHGEEDGDPAGSAVFAR